MSNVQTTSQALTEVENKRHFYAESQSTASHLFARTRSFHRPAFIRPAENQTRIADHQFKDEVFRSLNDLRNSKLLCDTIIRAETKEFPAHRCVLSAGSLYFRGLFATELGGSESQRKQPH